VTRRTLALIAAAGTLVAGRAAAQSNPEWVEAIKPFRIAPNLYYVGSKELASYLVTTPQGHILINSDLEANVPMIRSSIEQLGFRFADVKILLISQAHSDHDAGSAAIKAQTGTKYMVMAGDADVVESGGKTDFQYGADTSARYPAAHVDRILHDGDTVSLGDARLIARLTPGHTRGCTTWTMQVREGRALHDVVIVGGTTVNPGYRLVGNAKYPEIAADFEKTFRVLRSLRVDYFLGAHASYFNMAPKLAKAKEGAPSPLIDREGYLRFVNEREDAFRRELARQKGQSP
jgi:metallo-beta-lactamase class B